MHVCQGTYCVMPAVSANVARDAHLSVWSLGSCRACGTCTFVTELSLRECCPHSIAFCSQNVSVFRIAPRFLALFSQLFGLQLQDSHRAAQVARSRRICLPV